MTAAAPITEIAIAVVEQDDQFLVGKRPAGGALAGLWEFPGGKVGPGESPADAAARECWEETGLRVVIGEPFPTIVHTYPHGTLSLHFFRAKVDTAISEPHPRFQWVRRDKISTLSFPAANEAILAQLVGQRIDD